MLCRYVILYCYWKSLFPRIEIINHPTLLIFEISNSSPIFQTFILSLYFYISSFNIKNFANHPARLCTAEYSDWSDVSLDSANIRSFVQLLELYQPRYIFYFQALVRYSRVPSASPSCITAFPFLFLSPSNPLVIASARIRGISRVIHDMLVRFRWISLISKEFNERDTCMHIPITFFHGENRNLMHYPRPCLHDSYRTYVTQFDIVAIASTASLSERLTCRALNARILLSGSCASRK
jgi:hypothetical protein